MAKKNKNKSTKKSRAAKSRYKGSPLHKHNMKMAKQAKHKGTSKYPKKKSQKRHRGYAAGFFARHQATLAKEAQFAKIYQSAIKKYPEAMAKKMAHDGVRVYAARARKANAATAAARRKADAELKKAERKAKADAAKAAREYAKGAPARQAAYLEAHYAKPFTYV
jgi:high-affinity Fe2+/Pb2+ permease